jgi:acyl phosphate:glycerol-3-phosphate acyltransferase
VFAIVVAATRFVSLGAMLAAAFLPLALWLIDHPGPVLLVPAILAAILIFWRHRENLERLREGRENRFRWRK